MATTILTIPLLILFILINSIPIPSFSCPPNQKHALLNFKSNLTTIIHSRSEYVYPFSSWNPDSDCCYWDRVNCSKTKTRTVTELHLSKVVPWVDNPTSVSSDFFTLLFHVRSLKLLDISYNHLVGEIPAEALRNLTELVHLDMRHNHFNGTIPDQLFLLTNLRYLDMRNCSLYGGIPSSIANLKELEFLDFSENSFSKQIPTSIGRLHNMTILNLSKNRLTGPIPSLIQNLSKLETLLLQNNELDGEIPTSLFQIRTLKTLFIGGYENKLIWNNNAKLLPICGLKMISMQDCGISGQIPQWISSQKDLELLDLSINQLEGGFPDWLTKMEIGILILSDNLLNGSLPPTLFESKNLKVLALSRNNMSGELPDNVGNAKSMVILMLSENNFSGKIPISFSDMPGLRILDLSKNRFSGNDFPNFGDDPLSYLDLSYNDFSSKIQITFSTKIQNLFLGGNKFFGNLPGNFTKLENLVHLDLHNNDITGNFQDILPQITTLRALNVRNNSFKGYIPRKIRYLNFLQILDLSGNNLTGSIPQEIANLAGMIEVPPMSSSGYIFDVHISGVENSEIIFNIEDMILNWKNSFRGIWSGTLNLYTFLDLSDNKIFGEIPTSLGDLKSLHVLNISHNNISGHIPVSFENLENIESMDLSHNNISGSIPQSLEKLDELGILDVSNNRLTGKIPVGGSMSTMCEFKYFANNSGLCGMQIDVKCLEDSEDDGKQSWISWEGTLIGFPIGFFMSILIISYSIRFLTMFKF